MSAADAPEYDFIVVGAGPSGCTLAWRLANSARQPKVLLIEAGGANDDVSLLVDGDRWITRMNPTLNWGYKTIPQPQLHGRVIDYDRGKGLGGSTRINFGVFTIGPADDWNEIAKLVDDDDFTWSNVSRALQRLETYQPAPYDLPDYAAAYLKPDPDQHGKRGPLRIGLAKKWESIVTKMIDVSQEAGLTVNHDMNSGDPVGVGLAPASAYRGLRVTAAELLEERPVNLVVLVDTHVTRLLFNGTKCIGVETDTQQFLARHETILSCGALDSPKILLHSGVGPTDKLQQFGIAPVVNLPGVGATLKDHHHAFLVWERKDETSERRAYYQSASAQEAARAQWNRDHTGPLADIGTTVAIAWLKSDRVTSSAEFAALSAAKQAHLHRPTVPHFEIVYNCADPEYFMDPMNTPTIFNMGVFVMNNDSIGTLELASSDPKQPLLFDPKYLSREYDRRVAIEGTREALRIAAQESFSKDTITLRAGPATDSEDDILAFWRENTISTWHMSSTVPMCAVDGTDGYGEPAGKERGCVNSSFQVHGTIGLRVVDMSVVPFMMNCHTQAVAYGLGLIAGDKLVREYGLDSSP